MVERPDYLEQVKNEGFCHIHITMGYCWAPGKAAWWNYRRHMHKEPDGFGYVEWNFWVKGFYLKLMFCKQPTWRIKD
jgi:hypothetical protein